MAVDVIIMTFLIFPDLFNRFIGSFNLKVVILNILCINTLLAPCILNNTI